MHNQRWQGEEFQRYNKLDVRWWIDRSEMFFCSGDYDESLKAYDQALQLDGGDFRALSGKGVVLNALVRYDQALTFLIPEDQSSGSSRLGRESEGSKRSGQTLGGPSSV